MADSSADSPLSDEQFIGRLAEVDPVDHDTLPNADDVEAVGLVEAILAVESVAFAESAPSAGAFRLGDRTVTAVPEPVGSTSRPFGRLALLRRGRGALAAAAGAVALLFGFVLFGPENAEVALADVHAAAAAAAAADAGHSETTFSLAYTDEVAPFDPVDRGTIEGRAVVDYDGPDMTIGIDVDSVPDVFRPRALALLPELNEVRLVDDVLYVQAAGRWMAVDTGALVTEMAGGAVDPRAVLDTIQDLAEATEVGPTVIDGVPVTRYHSSLELDEGAWPRYGLIGFGSVRDLTDGVMAFDLYIDDAGNLRRFEISGHIQTLESPIERWTFEISTAFSALDEGITITAPENAEPFAPLAELGRG